MIGVVMASSSDMKFPGDANENENKEEGEQQDIEEGELPEEGEICDDDDSKEDLARAIAAAHLAKTQQTPTLAGPRKPRDYDREEAASARSSEGSMLSSWMSGLKQRTKAGAGASSSPSIDANEEYYGYRSASPVDSASDKDYRNRNGESADKDYRWNAPREEEGHRGQGGQDGVNEYGDSDYRASSPRAERRRRRSPSPPYGGSKRARGHSPIMRGGYRGRGFRGRWGERQICKFFREGYCRDGENCSYSHDAADSGRKAELCKFYQQGFCKKGLQCPLLHGEYPCKAFHKGECSKDPCQFSHVSLNNFTQPIYDQMMKDDELASRIAIPQGPLKRRVLLPGGPAGASPVHPGISGSTPVVVSTTTVTDPMPGGVLPPPSVVVPTLSSTPTVPISQPQLVIPPPLGVGVPRAPFPAFFPHHIMQNPGVVDPAALAAALPGLPMPPPIETAAAATAAATAAASAPQYPSTVKAGASVEEDDEADSSFNINRMLEQITSKVKKEEGLLEESPASPPMFSGETEAELDTARTIPSGHIPAWRLEPIDEIPVPHSSIDASVLQLSLTDSSLRNDPRVKKALSSQFDAFTNSLMNSAPPPLAQPAPIFQQQQSPPPAPAREDALSASKPVDPRAAAGRDPRKRSAASDPRMSLNSDPRLAASSARPSPRSNDSLKAPDQGNSSLQSAYGAGPAGSAEEQPYSLGMPGQETGDRDHRTSPSQYRSPPQNFDERGSFEWRRGSGNSGGWMPQVHSHTNYEWNQGRRSRDYNSGITYRSDYGSQDRDERELGKRAREDPEPSPPKNGETVTAPPGPISLREKRKNNEYESPLSRTRWAQ